MELGLDENLDDFVTLQVGDDSSPRHLRNTNGTSVAPCKGRDRERDSLSLDMAKLVGEHLLCKVKCLLK